VKNLRENGRQLVDERENLKKVQIFSIHFSVYGNRKKEEKKLFLCAAAKKQTSCTKNLLQILVPFFSQFSLLQLSCTHQVQQTLALER
jgi:hypothetical protein